MGNIIFEQPLTELARVSLRLDHLFKQLDTLSHLNSEKTTQFTVRVIIDIINILDRTDLKSKLSKEFDRYITIFSRLHSFPNVSQETLNVTLFELKKCKEHFISIKGKIAHSLRTNEFLTIIRQGLLSPGGDSNIDTPEYYYWLKLPPEIHKKQISTWLKEFKEIREAITLLLKIIRNGSEPTNCIANKGFYHATLNTQPPCKLLRVSFSKSLQLFPEISAGRHRMSIRFIVPNVEAHSQQTENDVNFKLTICNI